MGIRIDGTSDLINATDGSLTIEGQSINTTGIVTAASLVTADKIIHDGDTNTAIRFPSADTISFESGGEEHCRILDTGNFLVGATAVEDWDGSRSHRIQVRGTSSNNAGFSALITANDDNPSELVLGKSRGTGNTIVGSADDIGQIRFAANDGAGFHSVAWIRSTMDGTPGSDDLPSNLRFGTSADGGATVSERLRINSSGQVLIGGTSSVNGWGQTNRLQVHGSTWDTSGVTIAKLGGNSNSPNLVFTASRGSSVGTVVQNGDRLGYITFTGDDGTDVNSNAAKIYCEVDGSPGSNDLPGRLIFSTTADGADSASERLRISSDGGVALTGHSECSINALGNSSGTVTIDFRTANYISCTLTGTTTFANPTTESVGQSGSIIITQDGTGSRTASWGSQFKWVGGTAPTLTTTAAAVDRIDYLVVAADTIHCVASLDVK